MSTKENEVEEKGKKDLKNENGANSEASNQSEVKKSIDQKAGDETQIKTEDKKQELIEEKEDAGLQLEYFSKEELIKKINELEKDLEEKEKKLKELSGWKDKYMRLQAEFENTQKRWEKNRQYLRSQYTADVLKDFLPLYDSFKKALEATNEDDKIKQFYTQFMNILKSEGAEPMDTNKNDSFDYSKHEALTTVEKEDVPEHTILDVIQQGWKFKKDVLRYAKVVISKKPKPPEAEQEPEKEAEATTDKENEVEEGKESKSESESIPSQSSKSKKDEQSVNNSKESNEV
ncbi:MAG: nucleotide exchange factor GrpE [Promethearchaeota archaeon]|nr:MAG: nucleotide exchange factor GrpE [Candidatus Lokiarchaeota archaeon]